MSQDLSPNFSGALREAMEYFKFSDDSEERKKQEDAKRNLESKMTGLDNEMSYKTVGSVFESLDSKIKESGLEIGSDKIRNMKRRVLENMKGHVN